MNSLQTTPEAAGITVATFARSLTGVLMAVFANLGIAGKLRVLCVAGVVCAGAAGGVGL